MTNTVFWCATFPNGLRAVFEVQPQHVPREDIPESINWPVIHGRQIAIENRQGRWMTPAGELIDGDILERIYKVTVSVDYDGYGVNTKNSFNTAPRGSSC